jgi:type VII secretion-associated protein (TIGR03931 family)
MSAHVIEVGPNNIRQLCCRGEAVDDEEMVRAALDNIDDPVTLIDFHPVAVDSVWRTVLGSVACGNAGRTIVVHPSWWSPTCIDLVSRATNVLAGEVMLLPRSRLLSLAARGAAVVVEIAEFFVVIIGEAVVAETRGGEPECVALAVIRAVRRMMSGAGTEVVIDAPSMVSGATALARLIADGLYVHGRINAVQVDDARFKVFAAQIIKDKSGTCEALSAQTETHSSRRHRRAVGMTILVIVAVLSLVGAVSLGRHPASLGNGMSTTLLVEGHVAMEVPAQWPIQRIVAGPGSARVQVTSPSDPEVALHLTQSQLPIATLSATAESLERAIDAEPTGVFVDFNPAGTSAGRSAVTYREIRSAHDIQWIIVIDKAIRISIGCQSRHGQPDALRQVCDRAVQSARAVS